MRARVATLLLLPGGVAAGHALGDRISTLAGASGPALHHADLTSLLHLAIPFSLVVLVHAVVPALRAGVADVRFGLLAGCQLALFAGIELLERAPAGDAVLATAGDRTVWIGAAAQVAVAWLAAWLVGGAGRLADALLTVARAGAHSAIPIWSPARHAPLVARAVVTPIARRGPPVAAARR